MAKEIERKYLASKGAWQQAEGKRYRQGYLNLDKERTVRVRTIEDKEAYLTVKGITHGATRREYEYEIPVEDAEALFELCEGSLIEKKRYKVEHDGLTWEVDEFEGDNSGLIVAEVELESEDQQFEQPAWAGEEVSDDPRYYNANLAQKPYCNW